MCMQENIPTVPHAAPRIVPLGVCVTKNVLCTINLMKKYASVSVIANVHPYSNYTIANVNVFVIATVHQDLHLTRPCYCKCNRNCPPYF